MLVIGTLNDCIDEIVSFMDFDPDTTPTPFRYSLHPIDGRRIHAILNPNLDRLLDHRTTEGHDLPDLRSAVGLPLSQISGENMVFFVLT